MAAGNLPRRAQTGLFPVFPMPKTIEQRQLTSQPAYPKGFAFDFINGEFVLDGTGRLVLEDGYQSWARWCIKAILTERFSYMAYDRKHGVNLRQALKRRTHGEIQAAVSNTIKAALKQDARTSDVTSFTFTWTGDELDVSCTIIPTVGSPRPITVTLDATRAVA